MDKQIPEWPGERITWPNFFPLKSFSVHTANVAGQFGHLFQNFIIRQSRMQPQTSGAMRVSRIHESSRMIKNDSLPPARRNSHIPSLNSNFRPLVDTRTAPAMFTGTCSQQQPHLLNSLRQTGSFASLYTPCKIFYETIPSSAGRC